MTLPVLISYAYAKSFDWVKVKEQAPEIDLLIDCGAFTAHNQGKPVTLSEYYDFLETITYPVAGYFALDSIGDPKQTWINFKDMIDNGFEPMPIFTRGDKLERLEEYYQYSDIVALGGLWAGGKNDKGYVKYIMEDGFKGRKTHWLGFAVHNLICYFKPYSVDAINWKRALIYGRLSIWNGHKSVEAHRLDFKGKHLPPISKKIAKMGFDPHKLREEESWRGAHSYAHEVSTASYFEYTEQLKKFTGTKFHFVCNAQHELDFILKVYRERNKKITLV